MTEILISTKSLDIIGMEENDGLMSSAFKEYRVFTLIPYFDLDHSVLITNQIAICMCNHTYC